MFGLESLSGNAQAVVLIGLVLIEAIVLYVGYGTLERVVGKHVMQLLRGE